MTKGVNRAIRFKKSFNERYIEKKGPCIFLSHISLDKNMVRAIGNYIIKAGIDIYLDENDMELQTATQLGDDRSITKFIQKGIEESTHILCLLSDNTIESWWVPYEVGYGDMGNLDIASMKLRELTMPVPSYLKIHNLIEGIEELNTFLSRIMTKYMASPKLFETNQLDSYRSYNMASLIEKSVHHPLVKYLR